MTSMQRACDWYRKRMHIETFFSDQTSRGFQLDRSHLSEPERVKRMMLAACLAYLWVIYLSTVALQADWLPLIHRRSRCDLSCSNWVCGCWIIFSTICVLATAT
jgi:hypothetical protein